VTGQTIKICLCSYCQNNGSNVYHVTCMALTREIRRKWREKMAVWRRL